MQESSSNSIENILQREGFFLFTGNGSSMFPLIREGRDTVEVKPCTGIPEKGDVVLFKQNGRYVLHRVMEVRQEYVLTRGDNCASCEQVPLNDVFGKMTALWREEKKIQLDSAGYSIYKYVCMNCPRCFRITKALLRRI